MIGKQRYQEPGVEAELKCPSFKNDVGTKHSASAYNMLM